jgi:hypothetical protein
MAANKKFSVKLSVLITIFIVISLSGCFSEWHGDDANLTLYLGGGADRGAFTPDGKTLAQLSYVIELSGPSTSTVRTERGASSVSVSLFPGKWDITVTAYNEDESVYAIGKTTVEARAGQNVSKVITLNLEWKVFTDIEVFRAWLGDQPENNPTAPYHAKLNVNSLGVFSPPLGLGANSLLGNVLETNKGKYVKLDLSGSTFNSIGLSAFENCPSLTNIIIPNSVNSIGKQAFVFCSYLTSVTISYSVSIIEDAAFGGCYRLTSVTFQGGNITSFGSKAFIAEVKDNSLGGYACENGDNLKNAYIVAGAGTYIREGLLSSVWKHLGGGTLGKFWTAISDKKLQYICGIAWGNNKFVAVDSDGKMAYSSNGVNWTDIPYGTTTGTSTFPEDNSINAIIYGNDKFVAVGDYGKMAYSENGTTWTAVVNSKFGNENNNINAIAYGGGKFVAGGRYGKMAYSLDGIAWTEVESSKFDDDIFGITYGGGKFVAVGDKGKMAYSENGTTWTAVTNTTFNNTTKIDAIAYGGGKFVAGGNSNKMAYSSDGGVSWTTVTSSIFTNVTAITYGGGKFVAVGYGKIAYSSNGEAWTAAVKNNSFTGSSGEDIGIYATAYGGGKFVAGGNSGAMALSE